MERQYVADDEEANRLLKQYISNPQRWNRYGFCLNNPLKFVDPTGEKEEEITLRLNIVYDKKTIRTEKRARELAGKTIADAQKTYATAGIKLEVTFTAGTASGSVYEGPRAITDGRMEGAVNAFISEDRNAYTGGVTDGKTQDIFINWGTGIGSYGRPADPDVGVLAHEVGHVLINSADRASPHGHRMAYPVQEIMIIRDNAFLSAGRRTQTYMAPAPGRNSTHVQRPATREVPLIQIYRQGASRLR